MLSEKHLKKNDEEYNKVSVVDYAQKLLLPNHLTVPMKLLSFMPKEKSWVVKVM
jgi:hypothetical protein